MREVIKRREFINIFRCCCCLLISLLPAITVVEIVDNESSMYILAKAKCFNSSQEYAYVISGRVLYSLFFFFAIMLFSKFVLEKIVLARKLSISAVLLGMCMSVGRILGDSFYYVHTVDLMANNMLLSLYLFLIWWIVFWQVVRVIFWLFEVINTGLAEGKLRETKGFMFFCDKYIKRGVFLTFLICWLPCFILNYPTNSDYDTLFIFENTIYGLDDDGYAVVRLIFRVFLKLLPLLKTYANVCFFIMCVIGIASIWVLTEIFSYIYGHITTKNGRWAWLTIFIVVLIVPTYRSWMIYMSKDSIFSIAVLMFNFALYVFLFDNEYFNKKRIKYMSIGMVGAVGTVAIRHNGMIIIAAEVFLLLFYLLFVRDFSWKRILFIIIVCLIGGSIWGGVKKYAPKESYAYQILCYPIEYYSGVLNYVRDANILTRYAVDKQDKDVSEWDEEIIELLGLENAVYYYLYSQFGSVYPEYYGVNDDNKVEVLQIIQKKYKDVVFECIYDWNYSMFDVFLDPDEDGGKNTRTAADSGFLSRCGTEMTDINAVRERREVEWSLLEDSYDWFESIPIARKLGNMGIFVWMTVISSLYLVIKNGKRMAYVVVPSVITIVENLGVSYNSYFRYMLPVIYCMPFLLLLCVSAHPRNKPYD